MGAVIDVEVIRTVTEWALPGLACPCCGTVTFAEPPPGAHAGSVSYGPVLNAAAVVLTGYGNVPPERAAQVMAMLPGVPVSAGRAVKASGRLAAQLGKAGFDAAMLAALAGEKALYALGCWLREYKEQVFLFTRDIAADWTTNVAERGAKAAKHHQAVSGYWHSLATLARWCRIRSYLDSAAPHGITALDAIRDALTGKPWLPPLPAR